MEAISKVISLEPFYSRQKSVIPYLGMEQDGYNPSLNWGKIAYGVDFNKLSSSQEAVNKYGNGIKKLGVMMWPELMQWYHTAVNYLVSYTGAEPTPEEAEFIEKLRSVVQFVNDKRIIDEPEPYVDPCCVPCFTPSPDTVWDMDPAGDPYIPPYACVSICLVQSANIIGAYTFATKDWVAGKRYFAGDKVIYDGATYKLKEFTDCNATIDSTDRNCRGKATMPGVRFYSGTSISDFEQFGYVGLSEELFDGFVVKTKSEIVDFGYIYAKLIYNAGTYTYFIRPSWGGHPNSLDGTIYFDTLINDMNPSEGFVVRGEFETEHWKVADKITSYGSYSVGGCEKDVHIKDADQERNIGFGYITMDKITSESKLVNFKRNTKSKTYDGDELPGKFVSESTSEILDLQYIVGTIKNIDTTGEKVIGDVLYKIELDIDDGPTISLEANYSASHPPYLENTSIASYVGYNGKIRFEYYIGAELEKQDPDDVDSEYIYNGGEKNIQYLDTYNFTIEEDYADRDIDGQRTTKHYIYVDINYRDSLCDVVYENIFGYQDRVTLSPVTARTQSMTEGGSPVSPNFQNADYFMEDYQLGMSFVANNNENVYIDRGSATAFERHLRLSEVDTLEDLVNYGNGMFKMKE